MRGRRWNRTWFRGGARVAGLSLLIFVVSLISGIDTLRGANTDTAHVDVNAPLIFTGTLEVGAVCSRWAGSLLLKEMFSSPSFRGYGLATEIFQPFTNVTMCRMPQPPFPSRSDTRNSIRLQCLSRIYLEQFYQIDTAIKTAAAFETDDVF